MNFQKNKKVIMKFPHAVGKNINYTEPYWEGRKDLKMIQKFTDINFWDKFKKAVDKLAG